MSSYDQPRVFSYNLGVIDFGAGANVTRSIPLALGATQFRVLDIIAHVTEIFESDTSDAAVQIGRSGDLDAFAQLTIPNATAVGSMVSFRTAGGGLNSIYRAEAGGLAAIEAMVVTNVFAVDDAAVTGQAEVTVVVEYDYVKADL